MRYQAYSNEPTEPAKDIASLLHAEASSPNYQVVGSTNPFLQQKQPMMILQRPSSANSQRDALRAAQAQARSEKTYEQRQAEYQDARNRIFGGTSAQNGKYEREGSVAPSPAVSLERQPIQPEMEAVGFGAARRKPKKDSRQSSRANSPPSESQTGVSNKTRNSAQAT